MALFIYDVREGGMFDVAKNTCKALSCTIRCLRSVTKQLRDFQSHIIPSIMWWKWLVFGLR